MTAGSGDGRKRAAAEYGRRLLLGVAALVVLGLAVLAWNKVPVLYPLTVDPAADAGARATREASRSQSIVTTRASVLAALAGVAALATIAINYRNSRTQLETLRETARSYAAAEADRSRDVAQREEQAREDRDQREAVAREVAADATERRVTELYTAAAGQLGSEKAPVRLAGLYALERLAQSAPDQRQTIVNVFCGYLRMPAVPASSIPGGPEFGREELEVRRTAQRLIAAHLCPERFRLPAPAEYWPEVVEIDLQGAYLSGFDLSFCRIPAADFSGARFVGLAKFAMASFANRAFFMDTCWGEDASFTGARFAGLVAFDGATFHYGAIFDHARFAQQTTFSGSQFDRLIALRDARGDPTKENEWPPGWQLSGLPDADGFAGLTPCASSGL